MRFRNSRLRTKITALLLSLAALWGFAAWVTLRDGLNLLGVNTIDQKVTRPEVVLVTALQRERRLSLIYLGHNDSQQRRNAQQRRDAEQRGDTGQRGELDAQRAQTDKAAARFRALAGGGDVSWAADADLESQIKNIFQQLSRLDANRQAIDAKIIDRQRAADAFDGIIDAAFRAYRSAGAGLSDQKITTDSRTLVSMTWAKEVLAREDALLAGVLAAGRFTAAEHEEFAELVGAQRLLHQQASADLPPADRARYEQLASSGNFLRLRALEDKVIQKGRPGARPPVSAQTWQSTVQPLMTQLEKLTLTAGAELVDRAKPVAIGVIVRLILAGGLGLLAVISSIIVSVTTARALLRQLEKLRNAARELAEVRLPGVVERLGHGENVDVAAEAPPLSFGSDEIGQVGRAFNKVQETAIRTAVEQAELRRGIRDVLLSLARRSQALVHRQLTLLDDMERQRDDAKDLEELFRIDHLATRMRRNAENLIVLSGATPARGWRRPVPMIDVVRSAVAEVEDYTRVSVSSAMGDAALAGRAVGDIVHLLAELIENAVSFSPPYTQAEVSGRPVARGYAIEIEDRGLGMTDEILAAVNERISDPPEFNLSSSVHLGLFVVGRLAERYDVRVSLKHSTYGGTTAVVLIPHELLTGAAVDGPETAEEARATAGVLPATVGAHGEAASPTVAAARPLPALGDEYREESGPPRDSHSDLPMRRRKRNPLRTVPDIPTPEAPAPDAPVRETAGRDGSAPNGRGPDRGGADAAAGDAGAGAGSAPETAGSDGEPIVPQNPRSGDLEEARTTEMSHTPHGLPVRVPQASIAEPLRADGPPARQETDETAPGDRSPENVRRSVSGLQAATRRGRADAARSRADDGGRPDPAADDEA